MIRRRVVWMPTLILACAAIGCTGGPPKGIVSGTVRYRGIALNSGAVIFHGPQDRTGQAPIRADGSYKATDVPVGANKVSIFVPAAPTPPEGAGVQDPIAKGKASTPVIVPAQYSDPNTSGLEVTVKTGPNPRFDINLK